MIICNKKRTWAKGSLVTMSQDLANIVLAVKNFFIKRGLPEDIAIKCIVSCVKIACDDESRREEHLQQLFKRFEEGYERVKGVEKCE